jgi:hypothetical protein
MWLILFISLERERAAYERGEENMTVGWLIACRYFSSVMNSALSLLEENVIVALLHFKTLYGY